MPPQTEQLVLVLEDLDFPFGRPGIHTIGLLAPGTTQVDEGALAADGPGPTGGIRWVPTQGPRGTRIGYAGPRPLPGHGAHHYRFHVIALDAAIDPDAELPDIDALDPYVAGHTIALGTLEGHQTG